MSKEIHPFKQMIDSIKKDLNNINYESGDMSDVGNEIGYAVGKLFKEKDPNKKQQLDLTKESFFKGLTHGISLTDGTH